MSALRAELARVVEDYWDAIDVWDLRLLLLLISLVWTLMLGGVLVGRLRLRLWVLGSSAAVFGVVVLHVAVAAPFSILSLLLPLSGLLLLPLALRVLLFVAGVLVAVGGAVTVLLAEPASLLAASLFAAVGLTAALTAPLFSVASH